MCLDAVPGWTSRIYTARLMSREFLATILGSSPIPSRAPSGTETDDPADIAVTVEDSGQRMFRVVVGEREYAVDAARIRPGTWSLLIDGRSLIVDLDERRTGTTLCLGRNEYTIDLDDAQRKRLAQAMTKSGAAGGRGEIVRAPIAGKVVKLLAAEGDEVEVGQSVAVLEAMKMENEIKAERGGQVSALHVAEGQSVETNDKLLTLS